MKKKILTVGMIAFSGCVADLDHANGPAQAELDEFLQPVSHIEHPASGIVTRQVDGMRYVIYTDPELIAQKLDEFADQVIASEHLPEQQRIELLQSFDAAMANLPTEKSTQGGTWTGSQAGLTGCGYLTLSATFHRGLNGIALYTRVDVEFHHRAEPGPPAPVPINMTVWAKVSEDPARWNVKSYGPFGNITDITGTASMSAYGWYNDSSAWGYVYSEYGTPAGCGHYLFHVIPPSSAW